MRRLLVVLIGCVVFLTVWTTVAAAATPQRQYPQVENLRAFSSAADYMSLPGYLRYLVFQQAKHWITRTQAVSIVQEELKGNRVLMVF